MAPANAVRRRQPEQHGERTRRAQVSRRYCQATNNASSDAADGHARPEEARVVEFFEAAEAVGHQLTPRGGFDAGVL